jgi:3'(2'), 5'-bisphosphate nucleotidase
VHPFLDAVRPLAEKAATRLNELRRQPLTQERKADHSLVTNADYEADAIIRDGLRAAFPDHAVLTEESGLQGSPDAEYVWVVDPLDGTRAYIKNVPGYSVMVGVLRHGVPYAGIVADPVEGRLYEAVRGLGAYELHAGQRRALRVSDRREWPAMPVITSTGFPEPISSVLRRSWTGPWLQPINSVGIKVGFLIRKDADLYMNHHDVHYWDTCAPQIILEEAGGTITYGDGSPLAYGLDGKYRHLMWTLASNGPRHADALKVAQTAMPSPAL